MLSPEEKKKTKNKKTGICNTKGIEKTEIWMDAIGIFQCVIPFLFLVAEWNIEITKAQLQQNTLAQKQHNL